MSDKTRFATSEDSDGNWFVYDNESFYCVSGPLCEHDAIEMAIDLNEKLKGATQ